VVKNHQNEWKIDLANNGREETAPRFANKIDQKAWNNYKGKGKAAL